MCDCVIVNAVFQKITFILENRMADRLYVLLGVLAQLQPGDKLAVYHNRLTIQRSRTIWEAWKTRWFRYIHMQSKDASLEFVEQMLNQTNTSDFAGMDHKLFAQAIEGLDRLGRTYESDALTIARIQLIKSKLELHASHMLIGI